MRMYVMHDIYNIIKHTHTYNINIRMFTCSTIIKCINVRNYVIIIE